MVSFNVHCLTTPWKKAGAFRRLGRSKKRSNAAATRNSPSSARANAQNASMNQERGISASNKQNRGTPNKSRGRSPSSYRSSNNSSPISFDSKLTDSPTHPPIDDKPVEVVKKGPTPPFLKEDSLSVTSDNFSYGNPRPASGTSWREDDEEPSPNPFALRRKPNPRYHGSGSVSDWPTDTTDTSSFLYADDENSLYASSVTSTQTDPLPPTVGGTPRHSAGISSNYALREKLRSHMSKHMKAHKST